MPKIFKYIIQPQTVQTILIPSGSKILSVQAQQNEVCAWVLVDTEVTKTEERTFGVYATGDTVPANAKFLATVQLQGGGLVFHVFDLTPIPAYVSAEA